MLRTFRDETSVVDLRREKSSSRKLRTPLATMKTRRVNPSGITDTAHALSSFRGVSPLYKRTSHYETSLNDTHPPSLV